MKKLLLIAALIFASYGAFADEFDDLVTYIQEDSKSQNGIASIRAAKEYGIIFMDIKFPGSRKLSAEELDGGKKKIINEWRSGIPEFLAKVKKLRLVIIINFINEDREIFTMIVTPDDL